MRLTLIAGLTAVGVFMAGDSLAESCSKVLSANEDCFRNCQLQCTADRHSEEYERCVSACRNRCGAPS